MKKLSRTRKTALNTIVKLIYQVTTLVVGLIVPRLIIQAYGSHYNGVVSSITQFLTLSSILSIGIAGAMRAELYKTLAHNDTEGTSKIVKCTNYNYKKIGKVLFFYSLALAIFYPLFAKGQVYWVDILLLVIILSVTTYSEFFFGQTYYFLLEADQSAYVITSIKIIVQILNAALSVILIKIGASLVLVKTVTAVTLCSTPLIIKAYAFRKYKLNKNCELDKTLLRQRKASMFHSVANIVHDRTDVALLTLFTNFKIISVYTVFYSVVGNIKMLMQNFLSGLEGGFGNLWEKGERQLYKKHFSTYEFIVSCFVSVIFTCLLILLIPFVRLYTMGIKDINYVLPTFALLIVIAEIIYCFRQPYITAVQSVGHYQQTKIAALIEAVLNLTISLVLVIFLGLNGVMIGTIFANLYRTIHYGIYSSKHIIQRNFIFVILRMIWCACNMAIVYGIYKLCFVRFTVTNWGEWVLLGLIIFSISTSITLISALIFYKKDLRNTLKFIRNIF